ncbi:HepT-like ribonuclease domain-containing protein [Crocosphaera sp. UHCC 0190]|uniref:HepT-like ribonuclease domain-containing protein n=1 Tax=Crocosphaera sp. UHCC 0190 TaxID=3110246 RepID=UPI002B1F6F98|nr:HepT-like ribonuclease domain-containing protein [Crocosphaera sp. UHCC 0190]MEA5510956.1 HepT-like ribonuclease domain-containing protein [Crocosphaera sp. UHCC 0190]
MRDKILHEYSEVDLGVLCNTSQENIPDLIVKMQTVINQQQSFVLKEFLTVI